MLVLSRKLNEQIILNCRDEKVIVRVIEIHQGRVRLGITAPAHMPVHREEVANRILAMQDPKLSGDEQAVAPRASSRLNFG